MSTAPRRGVLYLLITAVFASSTSCAPTCTMIGSGLGGCCDSDFPCNSGFACDPTGTCQYPTIDPDKECVAYTTRCADDTTLEVCSEDGQSWLIDRRCDYRCEDGACLDMPCNEVPDRCEGTQIYGFNLDAGTWGVREACSTACESTDAGPVCVAE